MRERNRSLARGLLLLAMLIACSGPVSASELTATEANDLARRAYIYAFPLYEMYRTRYAALYRVGRAPLAMPNRFQHARELAGPQNRAVTAPNNDTLYSSAWLDLAAEPLVVHVPDTTGRYYSLAFIDFYTNNFAYIGRRTTGTKAGDYLVVGPRWEGTAPTGMPVIRSPTNAVWLLGRVLVDGPADLAAAHAVQHGFAITPLSGRAASVANAAAVKPNSDDPWNFFAVVDAALTENPPPASEQVLLQEFGRIGVGPGRVFDRAAFSSAESSGILAGIAAAQKMLAQAASGARNARGWAIPRKNLGNFGTDYTFRAVVALVGLAALEPAEAMYLGANTDEAGRRFDGSAHYVLHFAAGKLPPVDAFWSITMYEIEADRRRYLTANPIDRYSIGDRTTGLAHNSDGSLDIWIQHDRPEAAHVANWLPAPKGPFDLSLRAYQPRAELLDGQYRPPAVRRLD